MQIANIQKEEDVAIKRKLYTGVENFYVTAVNPTMKELNDMGIPATTEPEYFGIVEREYGAGLQKYQYATIRVFLDNKDPGNSILTQVQYQIIKDYVPSRTGKVKVINKYGSSAWLEETSIGGTLPSNMLWYVDEDVKKCYRGEDYLVAFMKALRNLTNVNQTSTADQKNAGIMMFAEEDFDKMFKGDFKDIRKEITSGTSKVGFMLGVREVEGIYRQSLYSKMPVRAYVKSSDKTDYLVKDIKDAQDNGSHSDVIFDLIDTKLKVYDSTIVPTVNIAEEEDDLPF